MHLVNYWITSCYHLLITLLGELPKMNEYLDDFKALERANQHTESEG